MSIWGKRRSHRHSSKPSFWDNLTMPEPQKKLNLQLDAKVSGGSIVGASHVGGENLLGKNNQDAFQAEISPDQAILVICDGCSMGKHSEVGAKILAKIILNAFKQHTQSEISPQKIVAEVEKTAIEKLKQVANSMIDSPTSSESPENQKAQLEQILNDYFAATIIGAYLTADKGFIWGLGDGVYGYNIEGSVKVEIVRAENNSPSYLFYNLYEKWPSDIPVKRLSVYKEFDNIPDCIMIGSDGVEDIIKLKGKNFPGTSEQIPSLEELLTNKKYLKSPSTVLEFLGKMQALVAEPEIKTELIKEANYREIKSRVFMSQKGRYLPDDTTMLLFGKDPKPAKIPMFKPVEQEWPIREIDESERTKLL